MSSDNLILFVFTPECWNMVTNMDINGFMSDCASMVISKLLGYAIMLGAAMVKIPQISKIMSSKSSKGVSVLSIYIESIGYALTTSYFYRSKYAISTYGENPLVYIQNIVLLLLIYQVNKQLNLISILKIIIFVGLFGVMISPNIIPMDIMTKAYSSQVFILLAARLPQIFEIFRNVCSLLNLKLHIIIFKTYIYTYVIDIIN